MSIVATILLLASVSASDRVNFVIRIPPNQEQENKICIDEKYSREVCECASKYMMSYIKYHGMDNLDEIREESRQFCTNQVEYINSNKEAIP